MQGDSQTLWTDDRIQATVTSDYVLKQFKADKQELLKRAISFGGGLTGRTYLGWILERASRIFLILVHIGASEQIFGLVDESFDDNDLPVPIDAVKELKLSGGSDRSLNRKFYKAQFIYLVRDLKQGRHIHFLDEETIPVKLVGSAGGINRSGKDGIEKVHIERVHLESGVIRVYGRKRIAPDEAPYYLTESDILSEINIAKKLANQHVFSLYASYGHGKNIFLLLSPAVEYTLNSFVDSPPKHFENLPKPQRREILLNWPHCLAHGLAWLHSNHRHHGALRPSNIVIDNEYRIYLGQIDGLPITHGNVKSSDIESYQYAAPERWKRAATMQKKAPAMLTLHSGGRTTRKPNTSRHSGSGSFSGSHEGRPSTTSPGSPGLPIDMSKPTSTAYPFIPTSKGNASRGQGRSVDGPGYAASIISSSSSGTRQERLNARRVPPNQPDSQYRDRTSSSASAGQSGISSHSAEGGRSSNNTMPSSVTVAPSEIRSALVQTWQSAQFDPQAADVFSLGAIILDVVTFLCKRSSSAFSRHRSAKNRTAGRGGGVADASFHANLGQVFSWTVSLEQEAKKKASKEEGKVFAAVGPMVEVALECLARAPEDRPESGSVETSLEGCVQQFTSSGKLHCSFRSASRGGDFDTSANLRSGPRFPPNPSTNARLRQPGLASTDSMADSTATSGRDAMSSSFASFNFDDYRHSADYELDEAVSEKGGYPASYPDDSTIDLQSIADRPDRIQNGTDISGWSHMHTESRASFVSSSTQSHSTIEPELMDSFFKPAGQPPALPPKQFYQAQPGGPLSQHPPNQSPLSSPDRKRDRPEGTQHRQRSFRSDGASQPDGGPGTGMAGPRSSESSTDSSQRSSGTSSMQHSRGRLSVSTLASNSSTIRLSWQQRDVSPESPGDANRTPNASTSVLSTPFDEDDVGPTAGDASPGSRFRHAEEQSMQPSKPEKPFRPDGVGRYFQRGSVSVVNTTGDGKGKKKAETKTESPGSRRAWLQRRYSILGGKM